MLVISRRSGERIIVGDDVVITVCATRRGEVRLGISAPSEVRIVREEICDLPHYREESHLRSEATA